MKLNHQAVALTLNTALEYLTLPENRVFNILFNVQVILKVSVS